MKIKYLLLVGLIVAFSSCSTAYRTGQTPDDVYYSPAPVQEVYVRTDNQDEKESYAYNNSTYNSEDMEIRRGIRDSRYRGSLSLGLGYGYPAYDYYNPIGSGYYNSHLYSGVNYNPYSYNPYSYNPYSYNPYSFNYFPSVYSNYYYYPQVYYYPQSGNVHQTITPRRYNLGAYNNTTTNTLIENHGYRPATNTTITSAAPIRSTTTAPATRSSGSGVGNFIRRVITPENNNRVFSRDNNSNNTSNNNNSSNYSNSNSSPVRSTPSASSSGSSSSGSSAPVRTFRK